MGIWRPTPHDWDQHQKTTRAALQAERDRVAAVNAADAAKKTARAQRNEDRQARIRAKAMRDTKGHPRLKEVKTRRGKTVVVAGGKKKRSR